MKRIFNIHKDTDDVGHVDIFGDIGKDWWTGEGNTTASVAEMLDKLKSSNCKSYHVRINSPGGDVSEANAIYDILRGLPNVTTEVIGMAASAATIIFMAGDTRLMSKAGKFLIHRCSSYAYGNSNDIAATLDTLRAFDETAISIYAERTGLSRDEVVTLMDANNGQGRWLQPADVLENGFCTSLSEGGVAVTDCVRDFYNVEDIKANHLPIPEDLEDIPLSLRQRIENLVNSIINKKQPQMKKVAISMANLAAVLGEVCQDEKGHFILDEADLQKIEDALVVKDKVLSDANNDHQKSIDMANADNAALQARIDELQAIIAKHANGDEPVSGKDNPKVNEQVNSDYYNAIKKELS